MLWDKKHAFETQIVKVRLDIQELQKERDGERDWIEEVKQREMKKLRKEKKEFDRELEEKKNKDSMKKQAEEEKL